MSKGSGRRPQLVSDDEAAANWARIFGKQPQQPKRPVPTSYLDPELYPTLHATRLGKLLAQIPDYLPDGQPTQQGQGR